MHRWMLVILVLCLGALHASTPSPESQALQRIADDFWKHRLNEEIHLRLKYGLPVQRIPDVSYQTAEKEANFARSILDRVQALNKNKLDHEQLLSVAMLEWESRGTVEGLKYYWFTSPVTPYASSFNEIHRVFREFQFESEHDAARYMDLLQAYYKYVAGITDFLKQQAAKGISIPNEEIQQVVNFLDSFVNPAEKSLFGVSAERLHTIPETSRAAFRDKVNEIVEEKINPEIKTLAAYLNGEYRNSAPESVGVAQYPSGKEYYRYLVTRHTTLSVTPEQVHRIGLDEVNRLSAKMNQIRAALGFQGSKSEFHEKLRADKRLYADSPEEVGETLMSFIRRIEPKVDEYFERKPKAPYGVKRLDPSLEASMTFGYYQEPTKSDPGGYYYFNGSNLADRSLLQAGGLIYHELIPGHHFQIALQGENESLPDFRRNAYPTAFVEGWGTYASQLAGEMGMYQNPYEEYGFLALDIFLTSRLVVDTGMNYLGWPRSRAVEFMKEHTLLSDREIETETLRYSTDIPAQALAYRMGTMKIRELREKAQEKLQDRFDTRKFHDVVLGSGAMPLSVLEQHIDWYIRTSQGS